MKYKISTYQREILGTIKWENGQIVIEGNNEINTQRIKQIIAEVENEGIYLRQGKHDGNGRWQELIAKKTKKDDEYFTLLLENLVLKRFLVEKSA